MLNKDSDELESEAIIARIQGEDSMNADTDPNRRSDQHTFEGMAPALENNARGLASENEQSSLPLVGHVGTREEPGD